MQNEMFLQERTAILSKINTNSEHVRILKKENRVAGLPIDNLQKVFSLDGRGVTLENIFKDS